MTRELRRRVSELPLRRRAVQQAAQIAMEAQLEQTAIRAISAVGSYGAFQAAELRHEANGLERIGLDATGEAAAIIGVTNGAILRRVQQFGLELD